MTNSTAILNHLQASKIIEVRTWAKVLWVKAVVAGRVVCRFVSKKIGTTMTLGDALEYTGSPKAVYLQFHNLPSFVESSDVLNLPVCLQEKVDFFNIPGVFIGSTAYLQEKFQFWAEHPNHIEMFCEEMGW
jgi:hypothetical protein